MRTVLTLNAGSSSLKFALIRLEPETQRLAWGQVERIGGQACLQLHDQHGHEESRDLRPGSNASAALDAVLKMLERFEAPVAVGHRIVHGGSEFVTPVRIDRRILEKLSTLDPLAPLHQPHNLAAVRYFLDTAPELPQIGVFDTGFHASMPAVATRLGLPGSYHLRGIRRYGFHGLSYRNAADELLRRAPEARRVIVAHLGNGASLCALRDGRSLDTTMGFSALDGLLMGTRSGSLDPGVILHLLDVEDMQVSELEDLLYRGSGLLGVSGVSHDMRDLLASDDPRAEAAIELFVYRVVKEAGALCSVLGGLDALVFTGGIGENAAPIRARIAEGLSWTGLKLDALANRSNRSELHAPDSRLPCLIVRCDEERVIAQACRDHFH